MEDSEAGKGWVGLGGMGMEVGDLHCLSLSPDDFLPESTRQCQVVPVLHLVRIIMTRSNFLFLLIN